MSTSVMLVEKEGRWAVCCRSCASQRRWCSNCDTTHCGCPWNRCPIDEGPGYEGYVSERDEMARTYFQQHPNEITLRKEASRLKSKALRKPLSKSSPSYGPNIRERAVMLLGGVCAVCGFSDMRALQIDHIFGGGVAEHRAGRGGVKLYRYILRGSTLGYQVLCANHNWIKRCENGEVSKGPKNKKRV